MHVCSSKVFLIASTVDEVSPRSGILHTLRYIGANTIRSFASSSSQEGIWYILRYQLSQRTKMVLRRFL